jgi:hypothetical protein
MKRRTLTLLLPLALGLSALWFLGTKAAGQETVTQVVQTATVEPTSQKVDAAPGNASEIQDYGRRESQNPGLAEFAGGHDDEVIIVAGVGCSGLLIAILILVILL